MPAHCLVSGEIAPRTGSDGVRYSIGFELRIPLAWNGRFQFQGGGGVDGTIPPAFGTLRDGVMPALSQGTAVVTSNMGHTGTSTRDATFGLDAQARIDWGYNAMDKVTVLAKALVTRFHGKAPAYSYYVGCSGGGRQGMMMSQRFPQHFDGVVSGAPILEQHLAQVGSMQQLQAFRAIAPADASGAKILSRAFSDDDLQLIANGVLAKCDALDGAADGLIENHGACTYDVQALQCTGAKQPGCLSAEQVGAFTRVMQGPKNGAGQLLYPPPPWDTGIAGWRATQLGTSTTATPNASEGDEPVDPLRVHDTAGTRVRLLRIRLRPRPRAPARVGRVHHDQRHRLRRLQGARRQDDRLQRPERFAREPGRRQPLVPQPGRRERRARGNATLRALLRRAGHGALQRRPRARPLRPRDRHLRLGREGHRADRADGHRHRFPGRTRPICAYPLIAR